MKKSHILRVVGLLLFLSGGIAWAQVNTGTILGTAKDPSGAVLPGVQVTILNVDTGISRTATTDEGGRYSAPSLSLGNYRVTGTVAGFQTLVRSGIVLTVGQDAVVDLSLTVGGVAQTVEVTGGAPLVETTTASLGSLVDESTIRALPLNGRSWDQLALLQPGVILLDTGGLGGNSSYLFGSGERFTVGGQRDVSNSFLLDGTNINDQGNGTPGGAAGTNLGVDTIREFKTFTNSFKAEYGHSSGSVTSAITRSGTNGFHGTAFEFIRNSAFDARNYFDVGSRTPPFKRNQFGGVLGGPIKKDKTFFFGGYEGLRQGQETTQFATVPTALARQGVLPTAAGATTTVKVPVNTAILPFLNLYPLPNGRNFGDGTAQFLSAPNVITNEDNAMVRVDHQLNSKTGIFGRYTYDNDNVNAPQSIPTEFVLTASRRQYATLQAATVLSVKAVNNFRFAYNRTHSTFDETFVPNPGPQVSFIPGEPFGSLGVGSSGAVFSITSLGVAKNDFKWAYNIFEWGDDFSYAAGKHSFKIGADIQRLQDNTATPNALFGVYTFATLSTFLQGQPSQLQASSPLGVTPLFGIRQSLYAFYGQDDYAVNSRLTLNLGLRWEATTDPYDANGQMAILPSPLATATVVSNHFFAITKKNFEPRLGIAWQLDASGKTVLRAAGGIYHNQFFPWAYAQAISQAPFFGGLKLNNPPFPNGYTVLKPNTSVNPKVMTPVEKTPVTDQYNVSIQRQISASTVIQVAYVGNHANHLLISEEEDTPIPTFINGDVSQPFYPFNAPRRNPTFNGIQVLSTTANSVYNAGTIMLRRQLSSGLQGQISYTYSAAMDEASSTTSSDQTRDPAEALNSWDPKQDWGLADFNARHAVVGNFTYILPFRVDSKVLGNVVNGWTVNGIVTFTSGLPFSVLDSTAVSRDQASSFAERPNLNPGFSPNPIHGTSAGCSGFPVGSPLGGPTNWYDPCAFSLPAAGRYGNVGRNTVIGPGVADVVTSLEKTFKLHEEANVTFRAEMFNIFNHPNFGLPNTAAIAANGQANPSAGVITYTATSSRQIQFGLRFNF